ncbi:glycosyltransferase family 4 protein [Candidatus Woesearchaeota archaeon]|nr:glycosyltransferase family 4 protein [Candidatus Woesearchaeota archaeon]
MMGKRVMIDWEADENVEWHDYSPKKNPDKKTRRSLLITTDNFLPRHDGISRFLSEILPRLKDKYEITVVCPDYGPARMDGVRIVQIPLRKKTFGDYTPAKFNLRDIKELVKSSDLVFNQGLGPIGLCGIIAAKTFRRPVISYIHSVEWELFPKAIANGIFRGPIVSFSKLFARLCYNRCTMLIMPSENIAEQFSWQRITTPKRVAHLGVDTTKFKQGNKRKIREKLDLPKDAFIVGFHGRIAHEKNILTLVRGFKRMDVKNKQLLIIGDGVKELKDRLRRIRGVTITGSTDKPEEYLQALDVYVMPSFTETTSLAVLEAMATGLPVVSSRVGFIKYYIIDGENGMFFDNKSGFDLMRKIEELSKDHVLRAKLGLNARKTIEKSFRWEMTAENVKDVLDEI